MNYQDLADQYTFAPTRQELEPYLHPEEVRKIIPAFLLKDQVVDLFWGEAAKMGVYLPWSKTHKDIKLRPHEVSVWAGVNGHGKTTLLSHVMMAAMAQHEKVCIASFEMLPPETVKRLCQQSVGVEKPTSEYIERFADWSDGKVWIYNQMNSVNPETLLAVIRYARHKLGIQHFVIDSLMKCGIPEKDYDKQHWFMDQICTIAKDTGIHIHLVAHSRKRETEKDVMDKFDIKGSGTITDMVDNVFTIWRNKHKEAEMQESDFDGDVATMPDGIMICDKQRHGSWEGKIYLWFDKASQQFRGKSDGRVVTAWETEQFLGAYE